METDPGTELPGMPACLHPRWGALSRGKASMCESKSVEILEVPVAVQLSGAFRWIPFLAQGFIILGLQFLGLLGWHV